MPIVRAQCSIPANSTVGADAVTNTFHFTTTGWDETIRGSVASAIQAFYEALDTYKSDIYAWSSARVKFYDLSESEPRVPLDDISLGLTTAPTGDSLPAEVAFCISFNGEYVSGASQARRRGRIYFGPMNIASMDTTSGRFVSNVTTAGQTAGTGLLTASNAASDWAWVVYSPTSGTSYPVVEGWCDNAPDIQRRRGTLATTRVVF